MDNLTIDDRFRLLLHKKIMNKTGSAKRRSKKYYKDQYRKTGIIPAPLLLVEKGIMDGRKCSGRSSSLNEAIKRRFIEMVKASANDGYAISCYIPKSQRTVVYFHGKLEEEFGKIEISSLYRLVSKLGLKEYFDKPGYQNKILEKRFVEIVKNKNYKNRTIIDYQKILEDEFSKVSMNILHIIIRKHNLEKHVKQRNKQESRIGSSQNIDNFKIKNLNHDDRKELIKWRNSNDKKKWERAVAILENSKLSLEQISFKIERPIRAIKKWIEDYNKYGMNSLKLKKNYDRTKTDEKNKAKANRIIEILHQNPSDYEINRSNWNQTSIASAYTKKYEENISRSMVSRLIKKSAYKWNKARKVLHSGDPDYREKVEELLNLLNSLADNEEFLFIDELGPLRVKKYGGRCYVKKGEIITTPQKQKSKGSITLSAALTAKTNQISWIYEKSKNSFSMINLIELLFDQYHNKSKLFITWDAASWHSSNELIEWLNEFNHSTTKFRNGPYIEFVPLPSCSQFLNVIEAVFSGMKRAVIHHSNYQSEIEMKKAISLHFQERNSHFLENPKRAGNKIWDINFFKDYNNIKSGNYREW